MVNLLGATRKSSAEDSAAAEAAAKKREEDNIDFTPDPEAMKKLGIAAPKRGDELDALNAEKIYRYQLDLDIQKIRDKKGSYAKRVFDFMLGRQEDPKYKEIALLRSLGVNGATEEVAQVTREISWRATARPEGVIAKKRYKEWLSGTPKGPSQAFLKDREQRKKDNELWENIKYDRLKKSKKQERLERKQRAEAYAAELKEKADRIEKEKEALALGKALLGKADEAKQRRFRELISAAKFEEIRVAPSDVDQSRSMKEWNKGHHFDDPMGNIERSFPIRSVLAMGEGAKASSEVVKYADSDDFVEAPPVSTSKFIKQGDNAEWAFASFNMEKNVKRADDFLKERERQKRDAARKLEREQRAEEKRLQKEADEWERLQAEGKEAGSDGEDDEDEEDEEYEEEEGKEKGGGDGEGEEGAHYQSDDVKGDDAEANAEAKAEEGAEDINDDGDDDGEAAKKKKKKKRKKRKEQADDAEDSLPQPPQPSCADLGVRLGRRVQTAARESLESVNNVIKRRARRNFAVLKLMMRHGRNYREHLALINEDGVIVPPPPEPIKEPWELPPGHEFRLTRSERRYYDKLKRTILEERRLAWEQENSEEAINARILAERMSREDKKFKLSYVLQDIQAFVTGKTPDYKKSAAQKIMEQRAQQEAVELKAEANNERAMELLFALREKQRQADQFFTDMKDFFLGTNTNMEIEYQVDDLIRESRAGDYNAVMDIISHEVTPIGPNDANPEGVSAFFTTLTMVMNQEGADISADLVGVSLLKRIMRWISKRAAGSKLDLVLRILIYKGGDVDFIKKDRDGDGMAIMHYAAAQGALKMIEWLVQKKAKINILSTSLKRTALMLAAKADRLDCVMLVLKNGGMLAVNAQDKNGWSALHFAACFAKPDIALVLIICGASVSLRNERGLLPVEEAQIRGRIEMVESIRTFQQKSVDNRSRIEFIATGYPPHERGKASLSRVMEEEDEEED